MIDNFVPSEWKEDIFFELVFDDGHNNGFAFSCDENGNVFSDIHECAKENLKWCLEHPEKFVRFNKVVRFTNRYREPAHGTCHCGEEVYLVDEYYGACQCPKCGQWYNTFGQMLRSPTFLPGDPEFEYEEVW